MTAITQRDLSAADLGVVLALARSGTLAEAGGQLGVDGSTVFRSLQRIEKGLRQRVFERSRSGYRPNELGLQLAQHAERVEVELDAARSAAQAVAGAVSGTVRISTTDTLLPGVVLPALQGLGPQHPRLQFELTASNELVNLTKRDADIALRATLRPPEHLVGRHLGPVRAALFGPRVAKPRRAAKPDPATRAWVAPDEALPEHLSVIWRRRHYPQVRPQYLVNGILSVMQAIAAGLGVGVLPLFLARGRADLVALSEPLDECETQLWLLTHPESRHLRRIATVSGHLAQYIRLEG